MHRNLLSKKSEVIAERDRRTRDAIRFAFADDKTLPYAIAVLQIGPSDRRLYQNPFPQGIF
ncbi:MAG: hypothetical protein KME43_25000 [Myxacorys chilensis ATA2-1-KO14]|nr:hypothetical protein [Myxacorys chilensis ATA2-1-KO14]